MKKKEEVKIKTKGKATLLVKKLSKNAGMPQYMMGSDLGLDLKAVENTTIKPMEQAFVKTGIAIQIPKGHVGLIRDRAGVVKEMNVHTAAGTFDPAFRGEVSVLMVNYSEEAVEIEAGMRIAQMLIIPVTKVEVKESPNLELTERYDKGFGSTGLKDKEEELEKLKGLFKHYLK